MEINIQTVGMTYPNGKQALKGLSLDLRSPSLWWVCWAPTGRANRP